MSRDLGSVRAKLAASVREHLPDGWQIKSGLAPLQQLARTTVFVEYKSIEPLPEAPLGNARCTFDLVVATGLNDVSKSEDAVDEAVLALILALDAHDWISWTRADKEAYGDYLAWRLTLTAIASTQDSEE